MQEVQPWHIRVDFVEEYAYYQLRTLGIELQTTLMSIDTGMPYVKFEKMIREKLQVVHERIIVCFDRDIEKSLWVEEDNTYLKCFNDRGYHFCIKSASGVKTLGYNTVCRIHEMESYIWRW